MIYLPVMLVKLKVKLAMWNSQKSDEHLSRKMYELYSLLCIISANVQGMFTLKQFNKRFNLTNKNENTNFIKPF